jgi:hypothetical protein
LKENISEASARTARSVRKVTTQNPVLLLSGLTALAIGAALVNEGLTSERRRR